MEVTRQLLFRVGLRSEKQKIYNRKRKIGEKEEELYKNPDNKCVEIHKFNDTNIDFTLHVNIWSLVPQIWIPSLFESPFLRPPKLGHCLQTSLKIH